MNVPRLMTPYLHSLLNTIREDCGEGELMGHSKHTQKFGSEKRQLSFKLN
jgi:hypothetical protein